MNLRKWLERLMFKVRRRPRETELPSVDELQKKVASSQRMANHAQSKLNKQKAQGREVRKVSKSLQELRVNNHFAESIEKSLRRSHW